MAKHHPVPGLTAKQSFREASGLMIDDRLQKMWDERDKTLAGDAEALHDMRVASRRLRAAMEIAAPGIHDKGFRHLLRRTKQLTEALGNVRDTDVLAVTLAELSAQVDDSGKRELNLLHQDMISARTKHAATLTAFLEALDRENYIDSLHTLAHHASGSAHAHRTDASETFSKPGSQADTPPQVNQITDPHSEPEKRVQTATSSQTKKTATTKKAKNSAQQEKPTVPIRQEQEALPVAVAVETPTVGQPQPNGLPDSKGALPYSETLLPNGKAEIPWARPALPNGHSALPNGHSADNSRKAQ